MHLLKHTHNMAVCNVIPNKSECVHITSTLFLYITSLIFSFFWCIPPSFSPKRVKVSTKEIAELSPFYKNGCHIFFHLIHTKIYTEIYAHTKKIYVCIKEKKNGKWSTKKKRWKGSRLFFTLFFLFSFFCSKKNFCRDNIELVWVSIL